MAIGAEERRKRDLERLEEFRLLDDTFMRAVMKDNLPLAQRVLRVITGIEGLELVREETQRDLKRVGGSHSVILDVFGEGPEGTQYDLEVQRGDDLDPLRFRYYGSSMDVDFLESGKDYSLLPQRWVVIVLESDPDGSDRATRTYCYTEKDDGRPYGDGTFFLYANAAYRGDDELGRLMADFCESDPDKIRDDLVRKRVKYLKRDPKGVAEMCRISEEIYNEGVQDGIEQGARDRLLDNVRSLMETVGWTAQEALERLKVPAAEQKRYLSML